MIQEFPKIELELWLSPRHLATYLDVEYEEISRMKRDGILPGIRLGAKTYRYRVSEVLPVLERYRVKTKEAA